MTAPTKVSGSPRDIRPIDVRRARRFPLSDGVPVEVIESRPSAAARLLSLASRALLPAAGTIRATVGLPNASAQLVRAPGVLPADGNRRVVLYLHGGAFLMCGANSHGRLVN